VGEFTVKVVNLNVKLIAIDVKEIDNVLVVLDNSVVTLGHDPVRQHPGDRAPKDGNGENCGSICFDNLQHG
jgi:hypothetical protein